MREYTEIAGKMSGKIIEVNTRNSKKTFVYHKETTGAIRYREFHRLFCVKTKLFSFNFLPELREDNTIISSLLNTSSKYARTFDRDVNHGCIPI
jgi:hypothetical protein